MPTGTVGVDAESLTTRGCSSVVERHVANVKVEGSSPFTRFQQAGPMGRPASFLGRGRPSGARVVQ